MDNEVNTKDFNSALKDEKNKKVFACLGKKYYSGIPPDEMESCKLLGLWKALKKYDPDKKRKFSNFLYVSVDWECKLYLRKNKRKYISCETFPSEVNSFDEVDISDFINSLSPRLKIVIRQRFFENLTMEEIGLKNDYSRETARRYLQEAIDKLKLQANNLID